MFARWLKFFDPECRCAAKAGGSGERRHFSFQTPRDFWSGKSVSAKGSFAAALTANLGSLESTVTGYPPPCDKGRPRDRQCREEGKVHGRPIADQRERRLFLFQTPRDVCSRKSLFAKGSYAAVLTATGMHRRMPGICAPFSVDVRFREERQRERVLYSRLLNFSMSASPLYRARAAHNAKYDLLVLRRAAQEPAGEARW